MFSFLHRNNFQINFLSGLIAFLPLSFILGNTFININIILFLVTSIIFFGGNIFKIKYNLLDKLVFSFFILIIFTGIYNDIYFIVNDLYPAGYNTILKSFFFLRYFLIYLFIRYLVERNLINFKYFFISCGIFSTFVCFDIFYQAIYGKDIFGYLPPEELRKLSGPFGDEYIAGGYIQRFSLFTFFILPIFYKDKFKKISFLLIPLFAVIFLLGILFSGNRMPFLLFLMTGILIIFFHKSARKYLIHLAIILPIIFFITYHFNEKIRDNYESFYERIINISLVIKSGDYKNPAFDSPAYDYLREFSTFYDTWLMNKYIGGGIKNFRYYCHVRPNLDKKAKFKCNMHPHNYYLEILTETGIVGFFIISSIFLFILYISIIKKYFLNFSNRDNHLMVPFMFLFFTEVFPIKTSGSFFTTGNAVYFFLIMAITASLAIKYNLNEKN